MKTIHYLARVLGEAAAEGLAQMRQDDGPGEKATGTEEDDTEKIVAPALCSAAGADKTTPGVSCRKAGAAPGGLAQLRQDDGPGEKATGTEEDDTEVITPPALCSAAGADKTTPGVSCRKAGAAPGGLVQLSNPE